MMRIVVKGCPPSLNQFVGKENGNEYRAAKSINAPELANSADAMAWFLEQEATG